MSNSPEVVYSGESDTSAASEVQSPHNLDSNIIEKG